MSIRAEWRSISGAWGAGLRAAMEYRASFLLQSIFMLANNLAYLSFWAIFFARFNGLAGWTLRDQAITYGTVASGFGLAAILAGGTHELGTRIAAGGLDSWLLRPRFALTQAATFRMRLSGFGDLLTGPVLLVACGGLTLARVAAFVFIATLIGISFASFWTLCGSAAFFIGRSEDAAQQGTNALLTFALYPEQFFGPFTRVLLYAVIPAGLVGWLPAELLRAWDWGQAGLLVIGTAALAAVAIGAWTRGLRAYESGSLTQAGLD